MPDKHEWRKQEKQFYLPKRKPEVVDVPEFKFISISGEGNPNEIKGSEKLDSNLNCPPLNLQPQINY